MDITKLTEEEFNARAEALKFIPSSGYSCAMEWLLIYFTELGDKEMVAAINKMERLKKNQVAAQIENHIYSAFDKQGIKQRVRDGSPI